MPDSQRYIPSALNDAKHLQTWGRDRLIHLTALPPLAQRYLLAFEAMKPEELARFLAILMVVNGSNLPPFPDQL